MGFYAQRTRHRFQNPRRSDPAGDLRAAGPRRRGPSGVSQPAVSKHLAVLKLAGLVRDRHAGRQTHYSAEPQGLTPLIDWMGLYGALPGH